MNITKFVLKRPVTTILGVLCLIVFGFSAVRNATLELTPEVDMAKMLILTTYPGGNPEDVNELISRRMEGPVSTLSGLKGISATSGENYSIVILEYEYGTDMNTAYDDLKKKVDQVSVDLPDGASAPVIMEINLSSSADVSLAVDKPGVENLYQYVNDNIVPEFEKISSAAEVSIVGGSKEYIKIELIPEKMNQYGVTMSTVINDIASANLSYPGGNTLVGSQELAVSTRMSFDTMELLNEIPVITQNNSLIYLEDVARIYQAAEKADSIARYNEEETISLSISKQQSATAMELSGAVSKTIEQLTASEQGLNIVVINDRADSIMDSLMSVAETLVMAIVISMTIIWLFFGDLKASLIVGSSIPVSILAALILMNGMGFSMNIITLSALTLGVGMMVDNSIVVLDSCFKVTAEQETGETDFYKDALLGARLVGMSVAGSTATTCVVFLPLAFLKGITGQLFRPLGFTIVFCMTASLLSALMIVPLCYMLYKPREQQKAPLFKLIHMMEEGYRRFMGKILPKKKTVAVLSVMLLAAALYLASTMDTELLTADDQGVIEIKVEARPGLVMEQIDDILKGIEAVIMADENLDSCMTTYGSSGIRRESAATIQAYLKDERTVKTTDLVREWKEQLDRIKNCNITVEDKPSMSMMSSATESYEVILRGADFNELKQVSEQVMAELKKQPILTKVHSSLENSAPVVEIKVDPIRARAAGVTAGIIGGTINQMLSGKEAAVLDVDGNDIPVRVEYAEDEYRSIDQLRNIVLGTKNGTYVALTDVADISFQDSPAVISRKDKEYEVVITGDYTELADSGSAKYINQSLLLPMLPAGISIGMNSLDSAMAEEFIALYYAIATAAFLLFVVMACQFESPKYSLMVMLTIPFSLIGAFGFLWMADSKISMVSLIGFLMLIGTVVNNGILYVDTVNQYRETMTLDTALVEAGATRLRPILMTTMTTVISMVPMAMAWGNSGEMTQGLALVNIGGLCASTLLSLLMLPVFYSLFQRRR